jgi:hypothetical protein
MTGASKSAVAFSFRQSRLMSRLDLRHALPAPRSGQRQASAADDVEFVSERIGWLLSAAQFGSAFLKPELAATQMASVIV